MPAKASKYVPPVYMPPFNMAPTPTSPSTHQLAVNAVAAICSDAAACLGVAVEQVVVAQQGGVQDGLRQVRQWETAIHGQSSGRE